MRIRPTVLEIENGIKSLALRARAAVPQGSVEHRIANHRARRPIDYMRYAEFSALAPWLNFAPGCRVLDAGGPQWLTLYLADQHPEVAFEYVNIFEDEVTPFAALARAAKLQNLEFKIGDLRRMTHADATFDLAYSISVLEHVTPEVGGDVDALRELSRILKRDAPIAITVPWKSEANVVYRDGPVYDRSTDQRQFYAREYGVEDLRKLVELSGLRQVELQPIVERLGWFAKDFIEWGPGRGSAMGKLKMKGMFLLERALGVPCERTAALAYLRHGELSEGRLVNAAILLQNAS